MKVSLRHLFNQKTTNELNSWQRAVGETYLRFWSLNQQYFCFKSWNSQTFLHLGDFRQFLSHSALVTQVINFKWRGKLKWLVPFDKIRIKTGSSFSIPPQGYPFSINVSQSYDLAWERAEYLVESVWYINFHERHIVEPFINFCRYIMISISYVSCSCREGK